MECKCLHIHVKLRYVVLCLMKECVAVCAWKLLYVKCIINYACSSNEVHFSQNCFSCNSCYFIFLVFDFIYTAPRLYLPSSEVYPGLETGKHIINIDIGVSNLFEFKDASPYEGSVLIYLPFLSTSPDGPAIYSLMISKTLPESLKGITELSELSSHPEISLMGATDVEVLRVTFDVPGDCDDDSTSLHRVLHEVDDKVIKSLIFGEDEMLYPYGCHDGKGPDTEAFAEHCAYYDKILPDVLEAAPNVCISTIIIREESCQTTFDVTGITQRTRDMLFLNDGPITV